MDTKTSPTALGYLKILGEFLNSRTNMGNQFFVDKETVILC